MYLDLFDELHINKRLLKLAGFEVAVYWAELQNVLKQVMKKRTYNEQGFFELDRDYMQRETTLTLAKQLKCDDVLIKLGVLIKDEENPNRLCISVQDMVAVITNEDLTKIKKSAAVKKDTQAAKIAGMKQNFKNTITTEDVDVRKALELWIDSMVDSKSCKFTKAVVQCFERTIFEFSDNKDIQLKVIEIATINCYKDANWAINRLDPKDRPAMTQQKVCSGVSNDVTF